jgi:hypothetical protein
MRAIAAAPVVVLACLAPVTSGRQIFGPAPLDASQPITYFIGGSNASTGYRPSDRELARWAIEAWRRVAPEAIRLRESVEADAVVRLYWAGPNDGQYGEMRPLMVGGRRGAAVYVRPDMNALGEAVASATKRDPLLRETIVYLTCLHELGHAFGLAHTRDVRDVMYFFGYGGDIVDYFTRHRARLRARADIAAVSALSTADVDGMRSRYSAPARP